MLPESPWRDGALSRGFYLLPSLVGCFLSASLAPLDALPRLLHLLLPLPELAAASVACCCTSTSASRPRAYRSISAFAA